MTKAKSNTNKVSIDAEMSKLCEMYDLGELRASFDMAGFLHDVSSDIECLRESLTDAIALADCGIVPNQDRLKQWRHVLSEPNA